MGYIDSPEFEKQVARGRKIMAENRVKFTREMVELHVSHAMQNVVGLELDRMITLRIPADPLEFAQDLREECVFVKHILDVLPRVYEDPELIDRRTTLYYKRGIAGFVAAGGELHQLGDYLYATYDGHEESLHSFPGDDRLRRWWSLIYAWSVRYSRKRMAEK